MRPHKHGGAHLVVQAMHSKQRWHIVLVRHARALLQPESVIQQRLWCTPRPVSLRKAASLAATEQGSVWC